MYFIDRNEINKTLEKMESLLTLFKNGNGWNKDDVHALALERIAHIVIESIIDVGNSMIDGFIMRDPGSYEDIIDIMEDEKVITADMAVPLKNVIEMRKMIVREFTEVNHAQLDEVLTNAFETLTQFPASVRHYLETELGPVSAFLPEDHE